MPITLLVRDESISGNIEHERPLELPSERITVRELIRERVYQDVQDFNRQQNEQAFRGLVQPTDTERVLNGTRPEFRLKTPRQIDWKEQFEKATEAFTRNGFLVFIGESQASSLDQEYIVHSGTNVSFVKLVMLVGG